MKSKLRLFLALAVLGPVLAVGCLLLGSSGIGFPSGTILDLRINRVAAGFVVGAALSCAGVVFQALLRNPLAEPYVLGVSGGAGLGAAAAILTGLASRAVFSLPAIAFLAAAVTLLIVLALSFDASGPSVYALILSGVIVSALCSSVLMFLVATMPAEGLHTVIWWMLGNLDPASSRLLRVSAAIVAAACCAVWLISPELNAMTMGRETAHNLGVRTGPVFILGLALGTALTAVAVGLAGLIGFVGLIVPHVMRSILGPDHRLLVPASAVAGGAFLAVCDAIARTVMMPELPVGVLTALCGGPFFLAILRGRRGRAWIE